MNYAPADMTQVLGLGSYVGELREGPDGNLYEWVEGVDGLGNPIGFWKKAFKAVKGAATKLAKAGLARLIPGPIKTLARGVCSNVNHLGPVATAVPMVMPYYAGAQGLCKVLRKTGIAEAPLGAVKLPPAARTAAKSVCGVINKLAPVLKWVPGAGGYFRKAQGMCTKLRSAGIAGMDGPIMEAPDGQLYEVVDTIGESGQPRRELRPIRLVIPAYVGPRRRGVRAQQPGRRVRPVRTRPTRRPVQTSAAVNGFDGFY